jgi:D-amino-acid dehydrogenase
LFTQRLAELLRTRGVIFRFETTVERLVVVGDKIECVVTSRGVTRADVVVVALASEAVFLLRPLGIDVPVYPVKGYALTVPIGDAAAAPRSSVMDEHTKLMVTRLGHRLRAAGIAEVGGYDRAVESTKCATVLKSVTDLFPAAADYARAEYWAGLRPMTPDGPPYLGRTPIVNLIVSLGQGSNGWTQACGCGRIIADIVSDRVPEIDLEGYGLER